MHVLSLTPSLSTLYEQLRNSKGVVNRRKTDNRMANKKDKHWSKNIPQKSNYWATETPLTQGMN